MRCDSKDDLRGRAAKDARTDRGPSFGSLRATLALILLVTGAALPTLVRSPHAAEPLYRGFAGQLTPAQRRARANYWASRRGLRFGIPARGYTRAVEQMRRMEAARARTGTTARLNGSPAALTWNFVGPQPMTNAVANFAAPIGATYNATGRVTAVAVDPSESGRLFVGAANGGVWMSTDGGASFEPIFDTQPTQAVGAIALDTVNTNPPTIYVGTGEANNSADSYYGAGIFKSTDLGASWISLAPRTFDHAGFARLAIDPTHNPPRLFAAATAFTSSANRADASFQEGNPTKSGLWRSTDGGTSWKQYSAGTFGCGFRPSPSSIPCPAEDVVIDPADPSRVYVGIESGDVFTSSNGGNTFTRACFTNDSPCKLPSGNFQIDRESVAVGPPAPRAPLACAGRSKACGTVYALLGAPDQSEYLGFFRSTDGGASWAKRSVPEFNNFGVTIDGTSPDNFSQEAYDQALLVSPNDHATVFFGGVGIYQSTDSGANWTFLAQNGGTHSDQHALVVAPDRDTVYLGNDGGVYKFGISAISGGAASFTSLNDTLSAGQIQGIGPHPTNNLKLLAGFQDNGTLLDTGGLGWDSVETGDGGFTLFDRRNPNSAYHTFASVGTVVNLAGSFDGGSTWSDFAPDLAMFQDSGPSFYPPLAGDPSVAGRVLLGAHRVYVADFVTQKVVKQTAQDLTGGCADSSCALQDVEFVPSDHSKAWALSMSNGAGTAFKLFNTTQADLNGGAKWSDVTANLHFNTINTQASGITPDPNNVPKALLSVSGFTAITGIGHVFKTADFGFSWARADGGGGSSSLPDVPVLKVLVDRTDLSGDTLYAATDVGVFRSGDGGKNWSAFNLGVIPAVPIFDIEQNNNGVIFVGSHGRGAYELPPPDAFANVSGAAKASGSPGQSVAAGGARVVNTSSASETFQGATITFSSPALFSSAMISVVKDGRVAATARVAKPSAATAFVFLPQVTVGPGKSLNLALKVVVADRVRGASTQRLASLTATGVQSVGGLPANLSTVSRN